MYKEKLKILTDFLGQSYSSGNERLFFCPKCNHHKKKLSVNIDKDKFKCWVCDYHGSSIRRLVRRYGNYSHQSDWSKFVPEMNIDKFEEVFAQSFAVQAEEAQRVALPEEFKPLSAKALSLVAKPARRYLFERGRNAGHSTMEDYTSVWRICWSGCRTIFQCNGNVDYFVEEHTRQLEKYTNRSLGEILC